MVTDLLEKPVLYSYRRCPYAMRARMALFYAGIPVEIREITLRDKPKSMLQLSPKGTVPVLVASQSEVIDESLEIMQWALAQHDPNTPIGWWHGRSQEQQELMLSWIHQNDGSFKRLLDAYKYPERHPEYSVDHYFAKALESHLMPMNLALEQHQFLLDEYLSLADVALFPFIRQFYGVDPLRFEQHKFVGLKRWLDDFLESPLFLKVMEKHPVWIDPTESTVITS